MENITNRKLKDLMLYKRWPWHVLFWLGYILFRFWLYYITVKFYPRIYLEYMLLSEVLLVAVTYFTLWLYKRLFLHGKYLIYFFTGTCTWLLYLYGRTVFQFSYLQKDPRFTGNFTDIFFNNIAVVLVYFLFVTACKYFKDGFIAQQSEAEKKEQQLRAEVNNLKSQIAPHFLFNTLNNLYGLAVDKSDKLPGLMLRLSDLLRHSLYETQKPLIPLTEELNVLKSYIQLESLRLEKDLELTLDENIPEDKDYMVAPLLLIVFMENAFKHAKYVESGRVQIHIKTIMLNDNIFNITIKNNYNNAIPRSSHGIGLTNVKRRLELLYPGDRHSLSIEKDENYFTVNLRLQLTNH